MIKTKFGQFSDQNVHFWANTFFSKIQKRHFSRLTKGLLDAKNLKKLMVGSVRTSVADRLTDGQTDGAGFIRTQRVLIKETNYNKVIK